jgi:hypothetical protein
MASTITAMMSIVLGGLVMAVQTAWQHSNGLEEAGTQGRTTIERIEYMISHAGLYRANGQPTTLGLAVVTHRWSLFDLPDALVVWSGGRMGGMAAAGVQQRLPRADELVIYTPDPKDPQRFVEITVPGNTSSIDFRSSSFNPTILSLIESRQAESTLLCDRIRLSRLQQWAQYDESVVANVRFELSLTPSDGDLASTAPGTSTWNGLMWSQGIVAGDSGMRQATVRMEMQIEPSDETPPGTEYTAVAIPFFGSASYRYVYQP